MIYFQEFFYYIWKMKANRYMKIVNFKFPKEQVLTKQSFRKTKQTFSGQCDLFCNEALRIINLPKVDPIEVIRNFINPNNLSYLRSVLEFFHQRNTRIEQTAIKFAEQQVLNHQNSTIIALRKKLNSSNKKIKMLIQQLNKKNEQLQKKSHKISILTHEQNNISKRNEKFTILRQIMNRDFHLISKNKFFNQTFFCNSFNLCTLEKGISETKNSKYIRKGDIDKKYQKPQNNSGACLISKSNKCRYQKNRKKTETFPCLFQQPFNKDQQNKNILENSEFKQIQTTKQVETKISNDQIKENNNDELQILNDFEKRSECKELDMEISECSDFNDDTFLI